MSGQNPRREYEQWLQYAREDLAVAQEGLGDPTFMPRHVCFLAQQAAEKAIKAALILLSIEFLYRHDLEYLNSLLPSEIQIHEDQFDLEQLSEWTVSARYPGDAVLPSDRDAEKAVEDAFGVVSWTDAQVNSLYLES